MDNPPNKLVRQSWLRGALIFVGMLSTLLAVVGVFLPVLPTVPLLLLAAACFARSSENFHHWLLEHPRIGPMIKDYLGGQGIPMRAKISAISLIWLSILFSVFFLVPLFWVKIFLVSIALCVTIYLLRLPVCERDRG
jgi:uncharacterized membrane protein YbaN (DUF454 family)